MVHLKTEEELAVMLLGGKILAEVKKKLVEAVKPGVSGRMIEAQAKSLIIGAGAEISFDKEPGYHWATCIDVNDGVVHGVPTEYKFREGDLVGIDVGLIYRGFNSDTTATVGVGKITGENEQMLAAGRRALNRAIEVVKAGRRIVDISQVIEETVRRAGYSPVAALAGHGIGKKLHEDPLIPGVVVRGVKSSPMIEVGMALAIEVIYTAGTGEVAYGGQIGTNGERSTSGGDGWTIVSHDGKMAAAFEETVVVTGQGVKVTTRG